jgi:hypothetical protein
MTISDKPQADLKFLSMIGPRRWIFETEEPLRFVLMPGFFDTVHGIRLDDEISVIAFGDFPASHALLTVTEIRRSESDKVRVSTLVEYQRSAA